MKGEQHHPSYRGPVTAEAAEALALEAFGRIASDDERLGRFLALTGLDPRGIRQAAGEPGFLPAVLEHVLGDEALLIEIAKELGVSPERLVAARHRLSPDPDWSP